MFTLKANSETVLISNRCTVKDYIFPRLTITYNNIWAFKTCINLFLGAVLDEQNFGRVESVGVKLKHYP